MADIFLLAENEVKLLYRALVAIINITLSMITKINAFTLSRKI